MFLLADCVGLTQPGIHFRIYLAGFTNNEVMHMIARREGFYFSESRIFQPARQNDVGHKTVVVQSID